MDFTGKTIWQQAADNTDRDYSELCLEWGVILNRPGYKGAWPDCAEPLRNDGWSRKITDLRRFAEEMKEGDLVVLRQGTSTVLAVREIVGPYLWTEQFGDVDGWDLQHVRRVRWLWKGPHHFNTYALKQGDTTQKLHAGPVTDWLSALWIPADAFNRPLADLPTETTSKDFSLHEISEFLFSKGVASASIEGLLGEIGELTRIARWYQKAEQRAERPSEHETVTYLVVPLLRALSWTPQRMAVEWNNVDVALFDHLPRSPEALRVVVEAKKMDNSCLTAKSQAESYAKDKPQCHRLIVTDGLRYGVYVREQNGSFRLHAYLNLTRLRDKYPVYQCQGAAEALLAMTPEWR